MNKLYENCGGANADVEQRLAASLTAESVELLPYLPYLLQDFWELGSDPDEMASLLEKHAQMGDSFRVLDLACGKGAVAIRLAQRLGVHVRGIDLLPDFIADAQSKAREHGVSPLCEFLVGDARDAAAHERGYDCVIFGAAGNVLGTPDDMLAALRGCVRPGGYLLIDDAYLSDGCTQADVGYDNYDYLTLAQWDEAFTRHRLAVVERRDATADAADSDDGLRHIRARADELIARHPDKQALFDGYVDSQRAEYDDLDHTVIGATWLLRVE